MSELIGALLLMGLCWAWGWLCGNERGENRGYFEGWDDAKKEGADDDCD